MIYKLVGVEFRVSACMKHNFFQNFFFFKFRKSHLVAANSLKANKFRVAFGIYALTVTLLTEISVCPYVCQYVCAYEYVNVKNWICLIP